MSQIRYRELHIRLNDSIALVIDVGSKEEIKNALAELAEFSQLVPGNQKSSHTADAPETNLADDAESPETRLEVRAGLEKGSLRSKTILAFKDSTPQLIRPSSFASVSDATLTLLLAVEAGLKRSSISFDDFRTIYDAQNIKTGSQLTMLLNNLKNSGYIDKTQYNNDRTIRLSAKGERKATEVLATLTE